MRGREFQKRKVLTILALSELEEFPCVVELQRIVIATNIDNAHLFELATGDGWASLALQYEFGRAAVFYNINTSRGHPQEIILPLLSNLFGKLIIFIKDRRANKVVSFDAQIFDTTDGHIIAISTAVHP